MLPLTLLAPQKVVDLLLTDSALSNAIAAAAEQNEVLVPNINAEQVLLSSSPPDLGDLVNQFSYPRICLYSAAVKNSHIEKFRTLSGSIAVVAEIWSSGNFLTDTGRWVHFYVDAFTTLLGDNIGDWGDGVFFPGTFDIQFQQPKRGGFGFLEMAKITCNLTVSR